MRMFLALAALTVTVISAGCSATGIANISRAKTTASPNPQASSVVTAACADRASDAETLQNAINASAAGSIIEIKGPVCLLDKGIVLRGDRTYAGYNTTGTVLRQAGKMGFMLASQAYTDNTPWTGNPLTVRDLTVACSGAGQTNGIVILSWQVDVEHVDVNGCGGSGIVDTNTTADGHPIDNTSVNSRFDNNFISNSGEYGFEGLDTRNSVTDGFLDDNLIAYSGNDAIHLQNAAGWDISGNHLYSDSRSGIYASRLFGTTISNNYIEDFGSTQESGTWYAIMGTAQGGVGSTIFNNKISNDRGESSGARYVYICVAETNYGTGYLSITGNVIVGDRPGDVGIAFSGGAHKLDAVSYGNEVANVGAARPGASDC